MVYRNKKDPTITASFDFEDPKFKTVRLIYLSGPDTGKSFSLNKLTLRDKWELVDDYVDKGTGMITGEKPWDYEQINKPYPEPKFQQYIPVPKSVLEYEAKKVRRKQCGFEKPADYEEFADILALHHIKMARVNTGYISLPDTTKLKLQQLGIAVLATNEVAEKLTNVGMTCSACIEKGTPFRFDIRTKEDFDKLLEALQTL